MAEDTTRNRLVTAPEFKKNVDAWMDSIIGISSNILQLRTRGTDELSRSLEKRMRYAEGGTEDEINRIAFKFKQYGVFVHYGVGRGYTRINGVVVKGYNTQVGNFTVLRKPVDFIDGVINRRITELADISGEYYGDKAFKKILKDFDKLKIQKNGKK